MEETEHFEFQPQRLTSQASSLTHFTSTSPPPESQDVGDIEGTNGNENENGHNGHEKNGFGSKKIQLVEIEDTRSTSLCSFRGHRLGYYWNALDQYGKADPRRRKRVRICITSNYYFIFLAFGMVYGGIGPTLPGLGRQIGADVSGQALLMLVRAAAYLCGCVAGGKAVDRFPAHRILAIAVIMMCVSSICTPFTKNLGELLVVFCVAGVGAALIDCVCNTTLVWCWGPEELPPFMQAMHFCYGVGSFISPLITSAVLDKTEGQLGPTFWTNAGIAFPLIFWPLALPSPKDKEHDAATLERMATNKLLLQQSSCYTRFREPIIVSAMGLFLFMAVGAEVGMGSWISTYVIHRYGATEVFGSLITSAYWAGFTFGRLLGIPLSKKLSPITMILMDLALGFLSLLIIIFSSTQGALWTGVVLNGIAIASLFPATVSLPPALKIPVSGKATSLFVIGSSAGELTVPYVIGICLDRFPPIIMMWLIFASFGFALLVLVALLVIAYVEHKNPQLAITSAMDLTQDIVEGDFEVKDAGER